MMMKNLIEVLLWMFGFLLAFPVLTLLFQVLSALVAKYFWHFKTINYAENRPKVAIIIPAHNEETGISSTLAALKPQLLHGDRMIVVADNCTDNTANIARASGAEVLERENKVQRGKSFALDYAIKHLQASPPEVVMIVDADCLASPNLVDHLAKLVSLENRPVQALDEMYFERADSLKKKLNEFAWITKNTVRPLGCKLFGWPCQLMGTGMAFPWKSLAQQNLANGHLVEDMKLGLDFAAMRQAPLFTQVASVKSYFPNNEEGLASQRARWEHGHLSMITQQVPKLLLKGLVTLNFPLFFMALDMLVPPLTFLFILNLGYLILTFWLGLYGFDAELSRLGLILFVLLGLSIVVAWLGFARQIIQFSELLVAPLVLFKKIPLYLRFFYNRQVEWVRSKRDN